MTVLFEVPGQPTPKEIELDSVPNKDDLVSINDSFYRVYGRICFIKDDIGVWYLKLQKAAGY